MNNPLQRRKALGSLDRSTNGIHDSNGIINRQGAVVRVIPITASQSHHSKTKPNGPLVVFRIIVIIIIIICIIWGYLIIKIVSDNSAGGGVRPSPLLARPYNIDASGGRSRIGWMIQQKINRIKMQMHPVPLLDVAHMDSPVLIIAYKRADYLERTLWKVFEHHPAQSQQMTANLRSAASMHDRGGKNGRRMAGAPIIVSQDGKNRHVTAVIDTYRQIFEMELGVPLYRIEHPRASIDPNSFEYDWSTPYKQLASHYGWALEQTFSGAAYSNGQKHNRQLPTPPLPQRVIILEEDIEISMDFFSMMNAAADILDSDETLMAVSAFNDNGKEEFVADTKRLVRSDFFPGLGWMMPRNVWECPASHPGSGLKVNWAPNGFWDDWLRESANRWGRQIIRPEVSRTYHFGNVHGASAGEKNDMLNKIELEENDVHWEDIDLSYLGQKHFADSYWNRVSRAKLVETVVEAKSYVAHSDVRLVYSNFEQFKRLASDLDIMDDEKAGVPRTAYEGIVEIRYGRGNFFIFVTSPYVKGSDKPEHFGMKAWMNYSKESLMQELGIENIPMEVEPPPIDWSFGWGK